jgi:DNA-binding CsgD family transcriptional regulator
MEPTSPETHALNNDPGGSDFEGLSDRLDHWRSHLNQYKHPVVLFDGNSWPVVLNQTLQKLVLDQSLIPNTSDTVSGLWKSACESAGNVVQRHTASSEGEVAEFFQLRGRCFLVLGSLIRASSERVVGAVINLAEFNLPNPALSGQVAKNMSVSAAGNDAKPEEDFHRWLACRRMAREKIAVLSRRESQVLAFVAEGQTNKCIARELGVTSKTVEKHRANAAVKLGATSSADLVRISVFAGHEVSSRAEPSNN